MSAWGSRIVQGVVNGHPCRMYAQRPASLADLFLDAERWCERDFLVQGSRRLTRGEHKRAVALDGLRPCVKAA